MAATVSAALLGLTAGTAVVDAAASVRITLRCYSNPEKTTITNTGTTTIRVTKVGSTYQPYSYEPFGLNKTLAPGQAVTYLTGNAASGANKLTGTYIYNDNGRDSARITTTIGTITKHC